MKKTCTKCGKSKPAAEMTKQPRSPDGLSSWCKRCVADSVAAYKRANPAKVAAANRAWRMANKERVRVYQRNSHRRRHLPAPLRPEPAACEACGNKYKQSLSLDHCHKTGKFRGWLCHRCNTALGMVGDCSAGVKRLLAYLRLSGAA